MTNFTSSLLKPGGNGTEQQINTKDTSPIINLKRLDGGLGDLPSGFHSAKDKATYPLLPMGTAHSPKTILYDQSALNSSDEEDERFFNGAGGSVGSSSGTSLSSSSSSPIRDATITSNISSMTSATSTTTTTTTTTSTSATDSSSISRSSDNMINYNNQVIPSSEFQKFVENESLSRKSSMTDYEEITIKQRIHFLFNWLVRQVKDSTLSDWIKFSLFVIIVIGICLAIFVFKVQNHLDVLQEFVNEFGVAIGGLVFMGVFILLIVFLIPVTIPTILGGIIFKPWFGILFVWGASVIGGTISFLLGRYVFRKSIVKKIEKNKKLLAVDQAIGQEGWKIVLLLRFTPIIPESLLNYALAVTRIKFQHYFICSAIGLLPGVSFFIYLGSVIGSVSEIKKVHIKKGEIALYIVSGVVMVFTLLFMIFIVKRAVNKKLEQEESKGLLDEEEKNNLNESTSSTNIFNGDEENAIN